MDIKPIRTTADHKAALKEVERLWDKAQPGTPEGDKFEVLSALVDAYERAHVKIPRARPNRSHPLSDGPGGADHEGLAPHLQDPRPRLGGDGQEATAQPRDDSTASRAALDPDRVPRSGLQVEGRPERRAIPTPLTGPSLALPSR